MLFQETQRLGCGRGDGDEMVGRIETDALGKILEILDQYVVGKFLADFFRCAGPALVVAQNAKPCGKLRRNGVPGMQRAAKLMKEHDRAPARTGKLVIEAHAIGIDERHDKLLKIPNR